MSEQTYKTRPITCTKCGEVLEVVKAKDRTPIHKKRLNALYEHYKAAHKNMSSSNPKG